MPLDLVARLDTVGSSAQHILERAASASGLAALDPRFLEAHKSDQLRRHPAGWVHRHAIAVQLCQPVVLLAGVLGFGFLGAHGMIGSAIACLVLAFPPAILPLLISTRGPARWEETWDPDLERVHPEVREVARRLKANLPSACLVLGELYQDRIRLDPYLVAEYRGARIMLGIWEDGRLILCA